MPAGGIAARASWAPEHVAVVDRLIQRVLSGAGVPASDVTRDGDLTRVVRRMCRDAERRRVIEPYLQVKK